ncbi:2-oxo acid dehydrogenase subunit E2 [Caldalkalibacillus thermarum]|nr:2-oxo acid dehydrogenase subunit E2 [Caldalkalibacillus thermarum]
MYIHDQLERRDIMPLSLTFDHRVLGGAPAAKFLSEVKYRLEHPYSLVI